MYASGITYTGVQSQSPAPGTLTGANNGLSPSTVITGDVVLGQNVGQVGNPAQLISNREIPMAANLINFFGGSSIFSNTATAGLGAGRILQVFDQITTARPVLYTQQTISTVLNSANTGTIFNTILTGGATPFTENSAVVSMQINGNSTWFLEANGNIELADTRNGAGVNNQGWGPTRYVNTPLVNNQQIAYSINSSWQPSVASANNNLIEIAVVSNWHPTIDAGLDYTVLSLAPRMQSGLMSNTARGIVFKPNVIGTIANQFCALETTVGDVYLCSHDAGNNLGKINIRRGEYNTARGLNDPTAFVHIGPSDGTAENGPLKMDPGVVVAAPEQGLFEFDNTAANNLFFTKAATRQNIVVGNDAAAAPGLTATPVFTSFYGGNTNALGDPVGWLQTTINGTVYKVPLYT